VNIGVAEEVCPLRRARRLLVRDKRDALGFTAPVLDFPYVAAMSVFGHSELGSN
jgi:hypothetical protein